MTPEEVLEIVLDAARQTQRLNASSHHTEGVAELQLRAIQELELFFAKHKFSSFQGNNI